MASSTSPARKAGDAVKIDFLESRADLNGRNAELVELLDERGRWHARVRALSAREDAFLRQQPRRAAPR